MWLNELWPVLILAAGWGAAGSCIRSDRQASSEIESETRGNLLPTTFVMFSASMIKKRRQTQSQIAWTASQNRMAQKGVSVLSLDACRPKLDVHCIQIRCSFWPNSSGATLADRNYAPFGKIRPVRRWSIDQAPSMRQRFFGESKYKEPIELEAIYKTFAGISTLPRK